MSGKKWILLVAGSKDWANYRHQANVCGLYQIIKKHGIPDEQIVVMMYDDIAHNPDNSKFDGQILSVVDDSNVYSHVPKDYTREDVTPENFLAALRGDTSTQKKVIESGPNDNIYVYMSSLGKEDEKFLEGPFQFPENTLNPDALNETLKSMHAEGKFSKMVIFMECSYSARMFKDLPDDINVWALASCKKDVPLCPSDYNDERGVYISDQFSSAWLKDLNTADFTTETFNHKIKARQSKFLKQHPDGPCPCVFGNKDYIKCHLSEFLQQ